MININLSNFFMNADELITYILNLGTLTKSPTTHYQVYANTFLVAHMMSKNEEYKDIVEGWVKNQLKMLNEKYGLKLSYFV